MPRENTWHEHLQELREAYRYRTFADTDYQFLLEHLIPYAMENDNVGRLIWLSIEELKKQEVS